MSKASETIDQHYKLLEDTYSKYNDLPSVEELISAYQMQQQMMECTDDQSIEMLQAMA